MDLLSYDLFLNITRLVVVSCVAITWARISKDKNEMVNIPWSLVAVIAALYGEKGISLAKALMGAQ